MLHQAKHAYQQQTLINLFDLFEIGLKTKSLVDFVIAQKDVFNKEAAEWVEKINLLIETMEIIAVKFAPPLKELLNNATLPENNEPLQKRIIGGSDYFFTGLENCIKEINNCKAVTDIKITATDGDKLLGSLHKAICEKAHLFAGCKIGFSLNTFLLQKRSFIIPKFSLTFYAGKSSLQKNDSPLPELYSLLRIKRDDICSQKNMPVYLVASSNSLDEMTRYLPQTFEELTKITGFGKVKTKKLGQAFLTIINDYCEMHNLHKNMEALPTKGKKTQNKKLLENDNKAESLTFFNEGKNIGEIAMERNLTLATVEEHIAYYVTAGKINIDDLVTIGKQTLIKKAVSVYGNGDIKLIFKNVANVSYSDINMMLAFLKK